MDIPLQVSFQDMDPSPAVTETIRQRAAKLERYFNHIVGCRVVVEELRKHSEKGKLFAVHIDLTVPGREIAVSHHGAENPAHADIRVAVRDAFDAAERMLEDHARRTHDRA